jgi:hypothetical protein
MTFRRMRAVNVPGVLVATTLGYGQPTAPMAPDEAKNSMTGTCM